ncbi:MAG: helix-turn-helix domain-containing protein, partial [Chloroflexota bacterium]|nr:helix-turn-helix domain-containing protein [Chloroflexota bacterium]
MEEVASFGAWLKARRQALDLTQEELAQRLNCALGTVRKWETEERRPSRELAEQLAVVLELAPEERRTFVKVARAELAVDHLRPPSRRALPRQALPPPEPAPPAGHAPLHTADRRPTNLPVQRERLIGRERELVEAAALLRRGDVGLVTLTGPGGVGKTRLALEVAAEVLDTFADGAWFVDLAPISDPALVAPTIAQTLGIKETGGQPISATLKAFLREQHLLLVLDNFEQVVAGAALLDDLLRAASGLKILVTSRVVLGVYGEHDMEVPPLALPDLALLPPPAQLAQYEAVRLFTERAQAAKADFQVTGETAPAVAEICHRLDGLPLAIELAAVRIRILPPQALLHRLTQIVPGRLMLLTGGARTLPARQQTLRDAIAWSYNLLEPGEQTLFRRLAVFAGGWTLEAAEAVCGGGPEELVGAEGQSGYPLAGEGAQETGDETSVPSVPMPPTSLLPVLDGLQSLVDKSLLRPLDEARGALAAEPRFGMLETIREYAREQWHNADEGERLRTRHLDFFLKLAEDAESQLHSTGQIIWLARLERERDNLRAALE